MEENRNADVVRFSDDKGCYFNGFRLESITITSYPKHLENDDLGNWRYCLEVPSDQVESKDERRFYSNWYKSPKATIAALDTKLRPWINPRWWIITIPLLLLISYQAGEHMGEMNGAKYQFEHLCGDSADNMLHKKIPDQDNSVPAYIQNYCKNWLLDDLVSHSLLDE